MLKKLTIYLIVIWQVTVISNITCQTGFTKLVDIPHLLAFDFDDILLVDEKLILRGDAYVDSIQRFGLFLCYFDTNGILLHQQTIFPDSSNSHLVTNAPCKFIRSKSNLILPTYYFDNNNPGLIITDLLGNKIREIEYINTERSLYPIKVIELNSDFYIFGRVQRLNNLGDDFILKTDSIGNKKWIKYYGGSTSEESFGDSFLNQDQTISISSLKYSPDYFDEPFGQGWLRPWIYTIDTSGTILEEWLGENEDQRTYGGGPLHRLTNGEWIIISREFKDSGNGFVASAPTISRLDSHFQIVWKHYLADYIGFHDHLIELAFDSVRDEFVAVGQKVAYYDEMDGALEFWALKFKPNGEIIWNISDTLRSDKVNGKRHFSSGVEISSTGSIYMAGYVDWGTPSRHYGWLVKITPDGCIDTLCPPTSLFDPSQDLNTLTIFPNPAKDQLNIVTNENFNSIRVVSVLGQTFSMPFVKNDFGFQLDTSLLPNGSYFILLYSDKGYRNSGQFVINK